FFADGRATSHGAVELPIFRGDDYVRDNRLPPPDVIKIEAQDFDASVVVGLRSTIAASRPAIVFRWSKHVADTVERHGGLESILPKDYRIYTVKGARPIMALLSEPTTKYHLTPYFKGADPEHILALPGPMAALLTGGNTDR